MAFQFAVFGATDLMILSTIILSALTKLQCNLKESSLILKRSKKSKN